MIAPRRSLSIAAVLVVLATAWRLDAQAPKVTVVFDDPKRFTDVEDAGQRTDAGTKAILDDLGRFIRETAARYLPADSSLTVRITDLDLAGEFEPWRGPQFARFRVMTETYWPRIDLQFRLADAQGRVVKEGKRSLSDPLYLTRSIRVEDERLRYEKDLLNDWLRKELAG